MMNKYNKGEYVQIKCSSYNYPWAVHWATKLGATKFTFGTLGAEYTGAVGKVLNRTKGYSRGYVYLVDLGHRDIVISERGLRRVSRLKGELLYEA